MLIGILVVPAQAQDAEPNAPVHVISVPNGESTTIPVSGVTRLGIGDGTIAGVVMAGQNQLVVNGKSQGRTTLTVWHGDNWTSYVINVTTQSLEEYARVLRGAMNEPHVSVEVSKNAIMVSGTVPDTAAFARVGDAIDRFAELSKKEKFTVVNSVVVQNRTSTVQQKIASVPGLENVTVSSDAKGNLYVGGNVDDRKTAERALRRAASDAGANLAADGKVIDRLTTTRTTQIGVKVYILEIDDEGLSQLGISLAGANPDPANPGSFLYGSPTFIALEGATKGINLEPFAQVTRLAPTLDLIITSGHAKMLSQPNLVTSPGVAAKFLVGGEIPYVVSSGLGQESITYHEYGVKLDMTPSILGNGEIETIIAPEVSQLDFQDGVTLNGFVVPAFKTSRLSTDVITHPGESVIMGGLLSRIDQRTISKIPLLGDLPVFGKLFRSTRYQSSQTDVVFILTPEAIVR